MVKHEAEALKQRLEAANPAWRYEVAETIDKLVPPVIGPYYVKRAGKRST